MRFLALKEHPQRLANETPVWLPFSRRGPHEPRRDTAGKCRADVDAERKLVSLSSRTFHGTEGFAAMTRPKNAQQIQPTWLPRQLTARRYGVNPEPSGAGSRNCRASHDR
jgi:hypothetical protein